MAHSGASVLTIPTDRVAPACDFNAWETEPVIVTVLVAVYKPDRSILKKGTAHHGGDVIATGVPGS